MEIKKIDISWKSIFRVLIVLLVCYFCYLISDLFAGFIFASIFAILLEPLISFFEKRKIPRIITIILIYFLIFLILGLFIYLLLPIFIIETKQIINLFPQYFQRLFSLIESSGVGSLDFISSFQDRLIDFSSNVFSVILSFFSGILLIVSILTLSIFFSIEKDEIKKLARLILPKKEEERFFRVWSRCQSRTARWFSIRFLSVIFVGIASYSFLSFFKIKHAFALSLFAGISDFVPIIGPIFAGFIFALLALLDSWEKSLLVIVTFTLIQQIEANILTPLFSKKIIGLPAILTLLALLVGGRLWGVLGAFLAVPLAGIIYEFLKDYLQNKNNA